MKKEESEKLKKKKVNISKITFWHSVKGKILSLVLGAILITVGIDIWTIVPKLTSNISELVKNYMFDVVKIVGESMDNQIRMSSYDAVMTTGNLSRLVGEVSIEGVEDS